MSAPTQPRRLLATNPPEIVVHDEPAPCPYIEGRTSRLPLRLPVRSLSGQELEERLDLGDRRQGLLLYRTACPSCNACEPIRIDVQRFEPSRSLRRARRTGDRHIEVEIGPLQPSAEKVALYNLHKQGRGLGSGEPPLGMNGYRAFLGESCCDSFEIRYRVDGQLIGVAVTDRSDESLSAVYCYYDPAYESLSPGTYSILKQIDLCRVWGLRYLYLGLFIAESVAMEYKARFLPHERRLDGIWQVIRHDDSLPREP